jgi:hypothetical protein
MALLSQSFDVNDLPEQQNDFSPLPEGWYTAFIKGAELRDTKDKTGQYIAIRYDIVGPTHQGRVVFGNINIKNKSTAAEEIGRQALGSIMRAIGLSRVENTDQLIGNNLQIKLSIRTQEGYEPTNDVRQFKAVEGGNLPPLSIVASNPSPTGSTVTPPWAKK